jgi:hypothetical protein
MRLLTLIAALLVATPVQAAMARASLLKCKGYSIRLNTPVKHEIAIYDTMAEFDGKQYQLSETPLQFRLFGPVPANDTIVYIYRPTGDYAITSVFPNGDVKKTEWSRKDEGCHKASQEF